MSYDILSDLTKYMSQKLNIPVSTRVPAREPKEFITVTRTGGSSTIGWDIANLAVQSWSTTDAAAYKLALAIRLLLLECWQELDKVIKVEVQSIYDFPDPDSKKYRYQLDVYITTRL